MRKQKDPKEDPSVISFRERQIRDLAKVDEEENRRIKQALFPRQRVFRRQSSRPNSGSVRSNAGSGGEAASARAFRFSGPTG